MTDLKFELFEKIHSNEDLFDFIQTKALDGLWLIRLNNTNIVWLNPKLWTVLGYHLPDSSKETVEFQAILKDDEFEHLLFKIHEHLKNQVSTFEHLVPFFNKDRSITSFICFGKILYSSIGEATHFLGALELQKEAVELDSIQKNVLDESFKLFAKNASDGMIISDAKGKMLYCSPSYLKQLGFNLEETLLHDSQAIFQMLHPDDRESIFESIFEALKNQKQELRYIFRVKHKLGHYIWREDLANFVYDEFGNHIRTYLICRDISESISNRNELQKTKQLLNSVVQTQKELISRFLPDTSLVFVNKAYCETFNLEEHELIGRKFLTLVPESDHATILEKLKSLTAKNPSISYKFNYFNSDGSLTWHEWTDTAIFNSSGEIIEYQSVGKNITQQLIEQEEQERLLEITVAQNQKLQQFAHIVSHNLRSHSGNITSLIQLIHQDYPEFQNSLLFSYLTKASNNLSESIKLLADVALITSKKIIERKPISLYESIQKGIYTVIGSISKDSITIINKVDENVKILGDNVSVNSIILNFLTKAIKYRSLERKSFIKFHSYSQNEYEVLCIEDNGLGIDLKLHRNKLFGMFKTFHTHPDAKGIGLFIAKNQIDQLNGKIEVESEVDKGSIFRVFFQKSNN